jgi:hypothetical protein
MSNPIRVDSNGRRPGQLGCVEVFLPPLSRAAEGKDTGAMWGNCGGDMWQVGFLGMRFFFWCVCVLPLNIFEHLNMERPKSRQFRLCNFEIHLLQARS